jgi:hypothetical protein
MFNEIPLKIPMTFVTEIEKSTQSSFGNLGDHHSQGDIHQESNAGGIVIPDFKPYYKQWQ